MNELVQLKRNEAFTDSMVIAEGTGNKHKNVKELILKYQNEMREFGTLSVLNGESTGGRPEQYYLLNEEQATFLMTLLRNSPKVVAFKKELVRQFYKMRLFIKEKTSEPWITSRRIGKLTRKSETDVIKEFVEYARTQGSTNAARYYTNFSKLAKDITGIQNRDTATIAQLNQLDMVERIILGVVRDGMITGVYYKQIYQNCKERLELVKELAYLGITTSEV